jgi:enhancing lycopene biosynthesis protein 2
MKIAVILSGCGMMDGSEVHESICTLLNLDKQGIEYQCFAPNLEQAKVANHFTHQADTNNPRNMLVEAARIARGNIKDLRDFNTIDFDAVIFPGGSGAVTNLIHSGSVLPDVSKIITDCFESRMPIGAICIAPMLIAQVLGSNGITITIGNDPKVASAIEQTGARHQECTAEDIVIDPENLIVTTPAYMLAKSIKEVDTGISKLVRAIAKLGR